MFHAVELEVTLITAYIFPNVKRKIKGENYNHMQMYICLYGSKPFVCCLIKMRELDLKSLKVIFAKFRLSV